jgi:DUF1365 family protein
VSRRWLYTGSVYHARHGVAANAFRYPGLFLCFPLAERQQLKGRLFGVNAFNLFAYHDADHGNGLDPEAWIRSILKVHGVDHADGDIRLMTMPRILGFVFNPVSFWFCHDSSGALRAVLCEVNNTFGERHCYLVTPPDGGLITPETTLVCDKVFHVSPFFPVRGEYHFRFFPRSNGLAVSIDYFQDQQLVLATSIAGKARELTTPALLSTFFRLGWATLMVVLRIHWQALRLWAKGATFHTKPEPPRKETSS